MTEQSTKEMTPEELEQGYSEEFYQEFFQAYMDSGAGPKRNGARIAMHRIVREKDKALLDKMFERVKLEPTFEE